MRSQQVSESRSYDVFKDPLCRVGLSSVIKKTQTTQRHHGLIPRVAFETPFRRVHCYGAQVLQGYQRKAYSSAKFHSLKRGVPPILLIKKVSLLIMGSTKQAFKTCGSG